MNRRVIRRGGRFRSAAIVLSAVWLLSTSVPATVAASPLVAPSPAASSPAASSPATPDFSLVASPRVLQVPAQQIAAGHQVGIWNNGRLPQEVDVQLLDFTQRRDGFQDFVATAPFSASRWVSVSPEHFQLEPGHNQRVGVSIRVPSKAEPGEHQVMLTFMTKAPQTGGDVRTSAGIGVPLLVTAPGPIVRSAQVTHLDVPGFALYGPITFTTTVRGTGTVHRAFTGHDHLTARVHGQNVAFPNFTVLRDSSRTVSTKWTHHPLMCLCAVKVSVTNPGGSSSTATAKVIVFPAVPAAVTVAGIALVLIALVIRRRLRSRPAPPTGPEPSASTGLRPASFG